MYAPLISTDANFIGCPFGGGPRMMEKHGLFRVSPNPTVIDKTLCFPVVPDRETFVFVQFF